MFTPPFDFWNLDFALHLERACFVVFQKCAEEKKETSVAFFFPRLEFDLILRLVF